MAVPQRAKERTYVIYALLAAVLYALNAPLSKLLLLDGEGVGSAMMAGLLYLGAGIGMLGLGLARRVRGQYDNASPERPLNRGDLPYIIGMVLLDVAAPILLMAGLALTSSAHAALLNNFEIVATTLVALVVFREPVSARLWVAIALITVSSAILSFEDASALAFSPGSLLVLGACVCWGIENNCTRQLSSADPLEVVVVKGLCSGSFSLVLALALGEALPRVATTVAILTLGFVAYGLSIFFYVRAQRGLGAARTSAYYAIAPFVSVAFSLVLFRSIPGPAFWLALAIMAVGTWLVP